jgi:[ribosomal protein S18]-alanine N-acetyltransferase
VRSREAIPADLEVVASWIGSRRECELWAGPGIPFPLETHALAAQIDMARAINVALEDRLGLAAFGQALARSSGRAHLARIIARPDARGRGVGRALVQTLLLRAAESGATLVTLNVYRDNAAALALYADLGFRRAEQPRDDSVPSAIWSLQRSIEPPPLRV